MSDGERNEDSPGALLCRKATALHQYSAGLSDGAERGGGAGVPNGAEADYAADPVCSEYSGTAGCAFSGRAVRRGIFGGWLRGGRLSGDNPEKFTGIFPSIWQTAS